MCDLEWLQEQELTRISWRSEAATKKTEPQMHTDSH
jgi:hypothetical protein